MSQQRWLRIIPVALIMYTISYVDRTNVSLALDPRISTMMHDLLMDDRLKGEAAGIFFLGYVLLQIPGGYLASRWSARKIISLFLVGWGACAVGCGLSQSFRQFEVTRFLLGMAESGVFPATLVLLANWFPRHERARANAFWNLCQPLAVAASAPVTGWLLGVYGWQKMIMIEGALPFLWLPIWWFGISDHPRDAKWISRGERDYLETTLRSEVDELQPSSGPAYRWFLDPTLLVRIVFYFLHNCAAYGCMTFFTSVLNGHNFSPVQYGVLFAVPYAVTAVVMIVTSWHSDKARERRGHIAAVYLMSGVSLLLSVLCRDYFWVSYAFMCLAIPGPFSGMAPFWAHASETLPRNVMAIVIGLVNAVGNVGGFAGPYIVGWFSVRYHSNAIGFNILGVGMLICSVLALMLPKARQSAVPTLATVRADTHA